MSFNYYTILREDNLFWVRKLFPPFFQSFGDLGFVALIGRMVKTAVFEIIRQVLLFDPMTFVVVGIVVALAVPETFAIAAGVHEVDRYGFGTIFLDLFLNLKISAN